MNSNTLISLLFASLVASLLAAPFGASLAAVALSVSGVFAVLIADYGRTIEPLRVRAAVIRFAPPQSELAKAA